MARMTDSAWLRNQYGPVPAPLPRPKRQPGISDVAASKLSLHGRLGPTRDYVERQVEPERLMSGRVNTGLSAVPVLSRTRTSDVRARARAHARASTRLSLPFLCPADDGICST